MANEEGISVAYHHVRELEHDLAGDVVVSGEGFCDAVGEDEIDGGGAAAAGGGNGMKTWRERISH